MKVAVILSGCGYLDGAEIRESVLTLLALDQRDVDVEIFAPDRIQHDTIDHKEGRPTQESRNMLTEAARIARGNIAPLSELQPSSFDALAIPGGFGVAKNLSDFAFKGSDVTLNQEFTDIILSFYTENKPIAAICIAPAVIAPALKERSITLTIGEDKDCASAITAFGNIHKNSPTHETVIDQTHRIASCSAYMRDDARISDVAKGIDATIDAIITMVKQRKQEAA